MSYITLKCKNCGGGMSNNPDSKTITCVHCGTTFMMIDFLDEKDIAFASKLSQENLQKKIDFADALKKGETLLFQSEYKLAEESFKRAIELDDKNYKGYFGVVKAKTSNLNKIPNSKDYKEYAKLAQAYASKEDEIYIKSELAKLSLLEREKEIQKKELEEERIRQLKAEKNRKENEKFFSMLACVLFVALTIVVVSCLYFTNIIKGKPNSAANAATYEITSAESLIEASQKDNFLSATIILKNDIDFNNRLWFPVGSQNKPFTGTIYGNNHTISNLKIKVLSHEGKCYTGLLGYTKNANILGLSLDNVSISETKNVEYTTKNYIGFISGYSEGTIIRKCQIKETCNINLNYNNKCTLSVGGIVGEADNCILSYTYSNSRIICSVQNIVSSNSYNQPINYYIGGICGNFNNSSITNCYSSSEIQSRLNSTELNEISVYAGGLLGYCNQTSNSEDKITACYFAGNIYSNVDAFTKKQYIAGIVGFGANFDQMTDNFSVFDSSTFIKNNKDMIISNFYDHSSNVNSVEYVSSNEIIEKIEQHFLSDYWQGVNTTTPSLKTN